MSLVKKHNLPHVPELKLVQKRIENTLPRDTSPVKHLANYFKKSQGKMIRPLLVLLSYRLAAKKSGSTFKPGPACYPGNGSPVLTPPLDLAAAVELIHLASLVHDDIIDEGTMRRGQTSLHLLVGKPKAAKAGDLLMAKAFQLLCHYPPEINLLFSRTTRMMCEGEAEQLERVNDFRLTREEYYQLNYKKTSCLLEACCISGIKSNACRGKEYLNALSIYGKYIGYAYQIIDDILDFTATPGEIGKQPGIDLSQGIITLPLIYLLQNYSLSHIEPLLRTDNQKDNKEKQIKLNKMVVESGALKHSINEAHTLCRKANRALNQLPRSASREQLRQVLRLLENKLCHPSRNYNTCDYHSIYPPGINTQQKKGNNQGE